jgi:hypothetical protein
MGAMMQLGVGGYSGDDRDNPFIVVAGGPLDSPCIKGPLTKPRREDLQVLSALGALSWTGVLLDPIEVLVGSDPPDRELRHNGRSWGLELTELTIEDVRHDLAEPRRFGRELSERILARSSEYRHLRGRLVTLSMLPGASLPRDFTPLLVSLEKVLAEDRGCVAEGLDLTQGLPQHIGERGLYGNHEPFNVLVNSNPGSDQIVISASASARLYQSEAIEGLRKRIASKDKPGNDVLLISCGLPDGRGYVCGLDGAIFEFLGKAGNSHITISRAAPEHIRGVVVHLWNSPLFLFWCGGDLPWVLGSVTPTLLLGEPAGAT